MLNLILINNDKRKLLIDTKISRFSNIYLLSIQQSWKDKTNSHLEVMYDEWFLMYDVKLQLWNCSASYDTTCIY